MIFIGLGANLVSHEHGPPMATLARALKTLHTDNCDVIRRSSWYRSAPQPVSSQPWFVNAVAEVKTDMTPDALLARLHAVEDAFGRERSVVNAPRTIDLDLLVYDELVLRNGPGPIIPHPRMQERAFVLLPLRELAPDWIDPRSGHALGDLIGDLPANQACWRVTEG